LTDRLKQGRNGEIQGRTNPMMPETWSVLSVAGAFFLLGIAGSPLAWVAILQRRSRLSHVMEKRWNELAGEVRRLEARLAQAESPGRQGKPTGDPLTTDASARFQPDPHRSFPAAWPRRSDAGLLEPLDGPSLIAVPNLAAAPQDREDSVNGLTQRYAAIWMLADQGASSEMIARATGQPIGQIELILGLRRQIDGTRTNIPHAPHTRSRRAEP
jgi:hypothetical protein